MTLRAFFTLSLLATTMPSFAETPNALTPQSFEAQVTVKVGYHYLETLPDGYDADQTKRWPLIVFLHGAGERGDNLELIKKHGPPKLIAAGQHFPAIVISPQCVAGQTWDPISVHALTQEIIKTRRVDVDRVYLTGISMGGFASWDAAFAYPDTYAALMPICGGAGVKFIMAERIKHIPEWIFHGGKDPVVDPAFSKKMNDVLLKLGAQVKFTVYPDAQHDSWTATYDNPEVWKWLFEQRRAQH